MRQRIMHHGARRRRERRRRAVWTGGELLVSVGVVLLLLVVHPLEGGSREAREGARQGVEALEREWGRGGGADSGTAADSGAPSASSSTPSTASPGSRAERALRAAAQDPAALTSDRSQAYAILTVPRLHLRVPVAEGVGKRSVLNKGY